MDTTCRETVQRLLGLIENTLTQAQQAQVNEHLAHCPGCREQHQRMRHAHAFLRTQLPPLAQSLRTPQYLALRIKHKLSQAPAIPWWQTTTARRALAAAAAIAIFVAATALVVPKRPQAQKPVIYVIIPQKTDQVIPELPRRDIPVRTANNPGAGTILPAAAGNNRNTPLHPQPTVQTPVIVVEPVVWNQEM